MSEPAPRCKAYASKRWYKEGPTPCRHPAVRDGYCHLHHPAKRGESGVIERDIQRAVNAAEGARKRVLYWEDQVKKLRAEQQRWKEFINGGDAP